MHINTNGIDGQAMVETDTLPYFDKEGFFAGSLREVNRSNGHDKQSDKCDQGLAFGRTKSLEASIARQGHGSIDEAEGGNCGPGL